MQEVTPNAKFRIGDVVMLKSGGPPMTVCKCENGIIACSWFTEVAPNNFKTTDQMLKVALVVKLKGCPVSGAWEVQ